ncbi:MAG: excinuclease ABC subunit UvrB [Alphaproteobacteria bacterium]|nr:excinuclease ABC subunit UvrB [Alphaproteobacteria bacterium]
MMKSVKKQQDEDEIWNNSCSGSWKAQRPVRPEKTNEYIPFKITVPFEPCGDQPEAIKRLVDGINENKRDQVLLGVTGSGKTYTIAQTIMQTQRPTLILAPNKILAAQLYEEFKNFFPENAVEYFVSYYDYYQPEAYIPRTNTYIEKVSSINEQIDRMRHAATQALLERNDTIIIASVSCIYGIGSVESYAAMTTTIKLRDSCKRQQLITDLVALRYERSDDYLVRGKFRVRGDSIELFPVHLEDQAWRISLFGDEVEEIAEFDPLTGQKNRNLPKIRIYANSHYVTPKPSLKKAIVTIRKELIERLEELSNNEKLVEAQRLEQRTRLDLEMIEATGFCTGIENYSRHLSGRSPGHPPPTLFEYLPDDSLLIVDESHVTIPQISAMFRGDFRRKLTLSEFGFRLPSCVDNRPLRFREWNTIRPLTIYVSATPAAWEQEQTCGTVIEQIIRPTGLVDPYCEIHPARTQVDHFLAEAQKLTEQGHRALVTVLTKRMAEDLTEYLHEQGIRARYMHSDINTLERIEIIRDLRLGAFDILVGINLLREGLDIPECSLVAIMDADKEGFLRSQTSLIQTIGRAARHVEGRAILYADKITSSMKATITEGERRRKIQLKYNKTNRIKPKTVKKAIGDTITSTYKKKSEKPSLKKDFEEKDKLTIEELKKRIKKTEKLMKEAAAHLEFEKAAQLRDEFKQLQKIELLLAERPSK